MHNQKLHTIDKVPQPSYDPFFSEDHRILQDILNTEIYYMPEPDYCETVQENVQFYMRKIIATWLCDVCIEEKCEAEAFALAMQLFDRTLSVKVMDKILLQTMGAACLLSASKIKENIPLTTEKLVCYTDFSISKEDLMRMEATVGHTLHWDFSGLTVLDVLHPTLNKLYKDGMLIQPSLQVIRMHVTDFLPKLLIDEECLVYRPTELTAACVAYVLQKVLPSHNKPCVIQHLRKTLQITSMTKFEACLAFLDRVLSSYFNIVSSSHNSEEEEITPNNTRDIDIS